MKPYILKQMEIIGITIAIKMIILFLLFLKKNMDQYFTCGLIMM